VRSARDCRCTYSDRCGRAAVIACMARRRYRACTEYLSFLAAWRIQLRDPVCAVCLRGTVDHRRPRFDTECDCAAVWRLGRVALAARTPDMAAMARPCNRICPGVLVIRGQRQLQTRRTRMGRGRGAVGVGLV